MNVAFGFRAHSGWAALVVLGKQRDEFVVIDRRRIELVEEPWAKQPYHAAETLKREAAQKLVRRGIDGAGRLALREIKAAIKRESDRQNKVIGCAVVVGAPMQKWSTAEILAVHFRMHKAEGALFQNALLWAAEKCKLKALPVLEKEVMAQASRQLGMRDELLVKKIAMLGKSVGSPWGKDQKNAALVAFMAMQQA